MKFLTYCFLWLFAVTNTIATMIYTGYYFLFIPQLNAAFIGWILVIFSLIEMPLILRAAHKGGTRHPKWLMRYIIIKIFCILLVIKFSLMLHSASQMLSVTEVLSAIFVIIHLISLGYINSVRTHKPRSTTRAYTASFFYLLAIVIAVSSIGMIGADIYSRIQTEYYAKNIEKEIQKKPTQITTTNWKNYDHPRKPEDVLPGFHMRIPPTWMINDKTFTVSTTSAKLSFDRSGKNSKLCIYPDTSRSNVLYNNHIYISLIPVASFDLNGQHNRLGLMPVERHSSTLNFLVCERWVRFDGLVEYASDTYNQNIGNVLISVNKNDIDSLNTMITMLQTITILP